MHRYSSLARAASASAIAAALTAAPQAAFAQDTETAEDVTGPVIIVTSQKREEVITDVPVTVTA
ncbi:MAG: hypothetical protein AAFO28_05425, partial [Pseudomonadota bacterium]